MQIITFIPAYLILHNINCTITLIYRSNLELQLLPLHCHLIHSHRTANPSTKSRHLGLWATPQTSFTILHPKLQTLPIITQTNMQEYKVHLRILSLPDMPRPAPKDTHCQPRVSLLLIPTLTASITLRRSQGLRPQPLILYGFPLVPMTSHRTLLRTRCRAARPSIQKPISIWQPQILCITNRDLLNLLSRRHL